MERGQQRLGRYRSEALTAPPAAGREAGARYAGTRAGFGAHPPCSVRYILALQVHGCGAVLEVMGPFFKRVRVCGKRLGRRRCRSL